MLHAFLQERTQEEGRGKREGGKALLWACTLTPRIVTTLMKQVAHTHTQQDRTESRKQCRPSGCCSCGSVMGSSREGWSEGRGWGGRGGLVIPCSSPKKRVRRGRGGAGGGRRGVDAARGCRSEKARKPKARRRRVREDASGDDVGGGRGRGQRRWRGVPQWHTEQGHTQSRGCDCPHKATLHRSTVGSSLRRASGRGETWRESSAHRRLPPRTILASGSPPITEENVNVNTKRRTLTRAREGRKQKKCDRQTRSRSTRQLSRLRRTPKGAGCMGGGERRKEKQIGYSDE